MQLGSKRQWGFLILFYGLLSLFTTVCSFRAQVAESGISYPLLWLFIGAGLTWLGWRLFRRPKANDPTAKGVSVMAAGDDLSSEMKKAPASLLLPGPDGSKVPVREDQLPSSPTDSSGDGKCHFEYTETRLKPTPWTFESFERGDLLAAKQHAGQCLDRNAEPYETVPAQVPCGNGSKPAVYVRVPDHAVRAFATTVELRNLQLESLSLPSDQVVLHIQFEFHDPQGYPIRARHLGPGSINIIAGNADLSTVTTHMILDPTDKASCDWLNAWRQWPQMVFFFSHTTPAASLSYIEVPTPDAVTASLREQSAQLPRLLRKAPMGNGNFAEARQKFLKALRT